MLRWLIAKWRGKQQARLRPIPNPDRRARSYAQMSPERLVRAYSAVACVHDKALANRTDRRRRAVCDEIMGRVNV